jgi:hypothetical protein
MGGGMKTTKSLRRRGAVRGQTGGGGVKFTSSSVT